MLNRMMSEYDKRKLQFRRFLVQKQWLPTSSGHCCITVYPKEFQIAYTRNVIDKLVLEFYTSYPYDETEGLKERLSAIVRQYQLKGVNCSWLLAPQNYQLLQTDALPVKASEFQSAIRWKIKDTLRFPIDDVVIDQFPMPQNKVNPVNKIMVVAAQRSYLHNISDEIRKTGLNLSFIDIPELALRNMMLLFQQDNESHALVYVQNTTIQLLITNQKQLYFSRNLEFGWGGLAEDIAVELTQHIEQLAGEIQRSFDYYESQWRLPNPTQVMIAATQLISDDTLHQLSQALTLPVKWFDLSSKLVTKQEMSREQQGVYLPMMGELFREECEHYVAAN